MSAGSCSPTGGITAPAERAANAFKLEWAEMEDRHRLTFETYEEGSSRWSSTWTWWSSTAGDRSARARFRVSCSSNEPFPQMIDSSLGSSRARAQGSRRQQRSARPRMVSRSDFRARRARGFLRHLVRRPDAQPDPEVFRLALEMAQVDARHVAYIENTPMSFRSREPRHSRHPSHRLRVHVGEASLTRTRARGRGSHSWSSLNRASLRSTADRRASSSLVPGQ